MDQERKGWFSKLPWYRKVAAILLAPFPLSIGVMVLAVFLVPCAALYAVGEILYFIDERRFRSRMRKKGRVLKRPAARDLIVAQGGTLIIESPSIGWGNTRAWWTPEDVQLIAPHGPPTDSEMRESAQEMRATPWDQWCFENFVSPDSGRALLLRIGAGKAWQRRIKRSFPNLKIIETWTAHARVDVDSRTEP